MTEVKERPAANSFSMLRTMVGIGMICGLLIVLTYEGTLPRIERLKAEALQQAVFNVLPGVERTRAFGWNGAEFGEATPGSTQIVYAGYDSTGRLRGVAVLASGQGYADIIRVLYGYNPELQQVVGFYVLESKETPGLGDKIEKDKAFLDNFRALDVRLKDGLAGLTNKIQLVKNGTKSNPWEIDAITGATISSRAIGGIIDESTSTWVPRIYQNLEFFNKAP